MENLQSQYVDHIILYDDLLSVWYILSSYHIISSVSFPCYGVCAKSYSYKRSTSQHPQVELTCLLDSLA